MGKGKWDTKRAQGSVFWASLRPSAGNQILMEWEYHRIAVKPYSTRRLMRIIVAILQLVYEGGCGRCNATASLKCSSSATLMY